MECVAVPTVLDEIDYAVDNELPPLIEDEEDMKADEKKALADEISKRVLDSINPHGARRVMRWLKEWGAISAVWAVPVALLGFVITLAIYAANLQSTIVTDLGGIKKRLDGIDARLNGIDGKLAKQTVVGQSFLSPADFNTALPELGNAISTLRQEKLTVPSDIVDSLQTKLLAADKQASGYWPAAVELVNYKFHLPSSPSSQNCLTLPSHYAADVHVTAGGNIVSPAHTYPTAEISEEVYDGSNCTIHLDDDGNFFSTSLGRAIQQERKRVPGTTQFALRLNNVRVIYSGGKILPFSSIEFRNCVFELVSSEGIPNKTTQSIATQLLAANFSEGKLYMGT